MMSSEKFNFTKDNIDNFLRELGKEYRKLSKQGQNVELIIVGGVAAIVNYDFRETTTDIDALFHANSIFKEAIRNVGDKYGLPDGWLNSDFKYCRELSGIRSDVMLSLYEDDGFISSSVGIFL